jgi:hypothetical protein
LERKEKQKKKKITENQGYSSVVKYLPGMYKALGSTPSTTEKGRERGREKKKVGADDLL